MSWYYANDGQQSGPVDEAGFADLVRQGTVGPETLVWREGMASWLPYRSVAQSSGMPASAPPAPSSDAGGSGQAAGEATGGMASGARAHPLMSSPVMSSPASAEQTRFCSQCGRSYPASQLETYGAATVCPSCRPAYLSGMTAGMTSAARPHYGGFWMRFLARIIDWILVGIAQAILQLPLSMIGLRANTEDPAAALASAGLLGIAWLIGIALGVFYEAYFLSTRGATPGKLALGLQVIRADNGQFPSAGLAVGRYFAQWLSGIILLIGYIIAGFDSEKRALHDHICGTRVVYK